MEPAHPIERDIGIAWYASETDDVGGRLKEDPADFRVTEVEGIDPHPIEADAAAYPHLIIRAELRGWDTFDFVDRLAGELGMHRGAINWAGTKDKAAITTQLFSVQGVDPAEIPRIPHATISVIGRFGRGLHYGDLAGNMFDIRVRDPTAPERGTQITEELTMFGDGRAAIPNFFGQQRFGSMRPVTHRVGLAILNRDWERAVMTYLSESTDREPEDTQKAREYIASTHDWEGGLERMPGGLRHEHRLLSALQAGDSFREALSALSERLRELFVHAAQSYLFNRILSVRREQHLPVTEAVPGDTVCFATSHDQLGAIPDLSRTQHVTPDRVDTVNRHVQNGRAFVTAPLVGTDTDIGDGPADEIVAQVLDHVDVKPADFDLPQPYNSSGIVRPILTHPNLTVEHDPLRFRFGLPSGAYATVVLREYLKVDPNVMS